MASFGDESVHLEKNSRCTRSGKIAKPAVTPQRRSRRTRKNQEQVSDPDDCLQDEENNVQSDVIQEMLAEAAQGIMGTSQKQEISQISEIQEMENVIPSEIEYSVPTPHIEDEIEIADTQGIRERLIEISTIQEEKSSSFPFGNITHSEHSDGGKNENSEETVTSECVDSSLLASLVGDNANSFPSAGEDSQSKENFENSSCSDNKVLQDQEIDINSSEPAIAESLNECESDATTTNVDPEMISDEDFSQLIKPKQNATDSLNEEFTESQLSQEAFVDEVIDIKYSEISTKRKAVSKSNDQYNPGSPTEEIDSPTEKKAKIETELKDKEKERKKLPELEKFWNTVKEDSTDFTGWTYLLQYVDQESDVEAAREAYDAFLQHYPYCYGYWRKYADYEKRKGDKSKCDEVFERGLKAIPLSVDLWIHYLTHVKSNFSTNEDHIRSQFERALNACGLEFRSDKLWDAFIKWETEGKRLKHIVKIYDRLLSIPTQGYNGHFDNFQDIINNNPPHLTVTAEEFKKLRTEVRESIKPKEGEESYMNVDEADDNVRNDEEATAIKDKIIAIRRKIHKVTVAAVTARWTFEEGIKRPYFHVKPLERCQLKNWTDYLEFEIEKDDRTRILILFERCLIACALYEEFWLKLIRYLEGQNDPELIQVTRNAFERACTIHHPGKPSLHLMWSAFEECQNNFDKAAEILTNIEEKSPNLLQITYRRINLERRRGDYNRCKELYEHYISTSKNKNVACSLAIKYARFHHKVLNDLDAGIDILKQTLDKDGSNTRLALQLIDLAVQRPNINEIEVVTIMDKFMSLENGDPDQNVLFAQRKVEFLEDFGSTARGLQDAQRELHAALTKANEANKKRESSPKRKNSITKDTPNSTSPTNQNTASTYNNNNFNNYGTTTNTSYYGSGQQYQSYDGYGYNHWQYGTSGYSNYGQWSNYGSYY